ncbi:gamma-mobile-trio recombinase GmtY [Marinobacter sp. AN1]|uniref:gamma-mobile-trio recombinase GmtY n=1 Tax=Marinobacter sp. AN1 TaxID=2886046 RepID=UPI0022302054|nr:gamma-mobile-trio recombinase GmtY [Marinobacter sp. AN1]UZD65681.1 gamma-mobile-trio recombinase GmtY [Marinobacter sp. AN1]
MLHSICLQANIKVDNTGVGVTLPVIITPEGLLKSYLDYLVVRRRKSQSWIERSTFAVRLLLDYTKQNEHCFDNHFDLFREFSNCLYTGTIGEDGSDPSWLRWKPRSESDAPFLISLITQYTDWLAKQNEDKSLQLNPTVKPTGYEQWMALAAHYQKKRRAFLSHLWADEPNSSNYRAVMPRETSQSMKAEPKKTFPEDRMNDLLWNGFVRYGYEESDKIYERLDLKNVLITLLMHYGGLRVSECFHVWTEDIIPWEDGTALVRVYHPAKGRSDARQPTRRERLQKRYGMKPRNEYPTSRALHAGWKGLLETVGAPLHYCLVYWFPAWAGETFNDLWRLYLIHQRHSDGGKHPFAFTTRTGAPHSIKGYNQSLKKAIERLVRIPDQGCH